MHRHTLYLIMRARLSRLRRCSPTSQVKGITHRASDEDATLSPYIQTNKRHARCRENALEQRPMAEALVGTLSGSVIFAFAEVLASGSSKRNVRIIVAVTGSAGLASTSWSSHLESLVVPQCMLHSFTVGQVSAAQ